MQKKAYTRPQLTVHGSVEKLTLQGFGTAKPCGGGDAFDLRGQSGCNGLGS